MKRREKLKKGRIFRWFAVFMAVMAICGAVSRGIYGMQLARIETGTVSMQGITHTISGTGTVSGGKEHPIYVKEGLRVEEVCVAEGENVEQGTLLFRLNMEELKEQLEAAQNALKEEQTRLSDLQKNRAQAFDAAAKEKERANADLNRITANQDALTANAQNDYDAAALALADYPPYEIYLEEEKKADSQYQLLEQAAQNEEGMENGGAEGSGENEGAREGGEDTEDGGDGENKENGEAVETGNAKEQFQTYREAFEKSVMERWQNGKAELEDALAGKEDALATAKQGREDAVETARRSAMDAGKTSSDEASLLTQQNAVDLAKEKADEYQALVDDNGQVLSEYEGTLQKVNLISGGRTSDEPAFVIVDGSEGWYFVGTVTEEEREYIKNGDEMQLKLPDSGLNYYGTQITNVTKGSDGMYEVWAKIEEPGVFWGEAGTFTITEENQKSNCRVPLSALYSENNSTYVLVVEEENTFLGTELRAVRKDVTVLDKNETDALLENGSLTSEEKIIVSSDRTVAPNDRVRLEEP